MMQGTAQGKRTYPLQVLAADTGAGETKALKFTADGIVRQPNTASQS
jgi:hypothetical protein